MTEYGCHKKVAYGDFPKKCKEGNPCVSVVGEEITACIWLVTTPLKGRKC